MCLIWNKSLVTTGSKPVSDVREITLSANTVRAFWRAVGTVGFICLKVTLWGSSPADHHPKSLFSESLWGHAISLHPSCWVHIFHWFDRCTKKWATGIVSVWDSSEGLCKWHYTALSRHVNNAFVWKWACVSVDGHHQAPGGVTFSEGRAAVSSY